MYSKIRLGTRIAAGNGGAASGQVEEENHEYFLKLLISKSLGFSQS